VGARDFGAFAVGFVVFTVAIGVGRGLAGQPLTIEYSDDSPAGQRAAASRALGAILLVTLPAGLVCMLAGLALGDPLRPVLLVLGPLLPGLVVQDTVRMAAFARGRPQWATLNDAFWAILQFAAVDLLISRGAASPATLTLAWGGSALAAALLGVFQLRARPHLRAGAGWIREHGQLAGYLVAQFLLGAGALQGGILLVGGLLGLGDLGSLRAAQTLTGPLGVLFSATMSAGLPELSRRRRMRAVHRRRLATVIGLAMLGCGLLWTAVLAVLPDAAGTALLGSTWPGARAVLLPVALVSAFAGACLGPVIVILAAGAGRRTFGLTVLEAVTVPTAMLAGARLGGAGGAAWGLAIQQAFLVLPWFRAVLSLPEPEPAPARLRLVASA
jgi:O-antigen/teichoic acid export membrane protein